MTDETFTLYQLVNQDPRYPIEAYVFVREALAFAADSMELGAQTYEAELNLGLGVKPSPRERHLTGQQLCEAIRQYALNQFGYMAKVVLRNWGIEQTQCFGDIVYNMIDAGIMKKSSQDKRSHFDDVYLFDEVFQTHFEICDSLAQRRS